MHRYAVAAGLVMAMVMLPRAGEPNGARALADLLRWAGAGDVREFCGQMAAWLRLLSAHLRRRGRKDYSFVRYEAELDEPGRNRIRLALVGFGDR